MGNDPVKRNTSITVCVRHKSASRAYTHSNDSRFVAELRGDDTLYFVGGGDFDPGILPERL